MDGYLTNFAVLRDKKNQLFLVVNSNGSLKVLRWTDEQHRRRHVISSFKFPSENYPNSVVVFSFSRFCENHTLRAAEVSASCILQICGVNADRYRQLRTHQNLCRLAFCFLKLYTLFDEFFPIVFFSINFTVTIYRKHYPFLHK